MAKKYIARYCPFQVVRDRNHWDTDGSSLEICWSRPLTSLGLWSLFQFNCRSRVGSISIIHNHPKIRFLWIENSGNMTSSCFLLGLFGRDYPVQFFYSFNSAAQQNEQRAQLTDDRILPSELWSWDFYTSWWQAKSLRNSGVIFDSLSPSISPVSNDKIVCLLPGLCPTAPWGITSTGRTSGSGRSLSPTSTSGSPTTG